MTEYPSDLLPLPTAPYDKRPTELPLDVEECRTALWLRRGNVTEAAKLIKTPPARLRKFIAGSPRLQAEIKEAQEQLLDLAEDVAYEALTDAEDIGRRDTMARFVMTNLGKSRGYGNNTAGVSLNLPKGNIVIQWGDGSSLSASDEPKTIEHNEAAE